VVSGEVFAVGFKGRLVLKLAADQVAGHVWAFVAPDSR